MHVKQSLVHAIFTSHILSTVYLINIIQVAAFLDVSGDGSSGCSPSQLHIYMYFSPLPSRLICRFGGGTAGATCSICATAKS